MILIKSRFSIIATAFDAYTQRNLSLRRPAITTMHTNDAMLRYAAKVPPTNRILSISLVYRVLEPEDGILHYEAIHAFWKV